MTFYPNVCLLCGRPTHGSKSHLCQLCNVGMIEILTRNKMSEITAEQFAEWKANPVTKEVFKQVNGAKQVLVDKLAEGQTLAHNADVTHGLTSKIIGQIEGLNQLLNIEFVESFKDIDDKDQVSGY